MFKALVTDDKGLNQWISVIADAKDLAKRGILIDECTGLEYYSGYPYKALFDWDLYFETIIQMYFGWPTTYARNGVTMFLQSQHESGYIPRNSPPYGFPEGSDEHTKPFLAQTTLMVSRHDRDCSWLSDELFARMEKYINYWLFDLDRNQDGLSEWDSAPHSGMDNQHERAGYWNDKFCEGVDLNSYLVRECRAFALLAENRGHADIAASFREYAVQRTSRIQEVCWNDDDSWFYDIDARTGEQIKVKSAAGFAAMWAGIATQEQADKMVINHLLNPDEFWTPYPIAAYARNEPRYSQVPLPNDLGCLWRANAWIPVNYFVYESLKKYNYKAIASILAKKTYDLVLASHPNPREYYNSETGEGMGQELFWGWTLLAYLLPLEEITDVDPTAIDGSASNYIRISI